jgi:hypothetical protein
MEPPAKRLRILHSVEPDETDLDFIHAKQKVQQKFKGRLESIFTKYESMHESMSDEIDMRENKVVVDRGHLRRLGRQVNRKETQILLDTLGLAGGKEPEEQSGDEEEAEYESADELAPTELPKSSSGRTKKPQQPGPAGVLGASSQENGRLQDRASPPIVSTAAQSLTQHMPATPNPAANLLQLVQFPQTPAGQQAHSSFYATLAQTINQAVQQAVAPLFSTLLPNAPNAQLSFATPLPRPATPTISNDQIAPATDPKWFFPPLTKELHQLAVQSSPLPASASTSQDTQPHGKERVPQHQHPLDDGDESACIYNAQIAHSSPTHVRKDTSVASRPRRSSPRVEIPTKCKRVPKYQFTEADDIHISALRVLYERNWLQIRDSKEIWKSWPLNAFSNRWHLHLKDRDLHLQAQSTPRAPSHVSENEATVSPLHHLPTPSSLVHEDTAKQEDIDMKAESTEAVPSSSAHFDDDELDLLSLNGGNSDEEQLPTETEADENIFSDDEDVILPSVETADSSSEDELQQGLLEGLPRPETTPKATLPTSTAIKIEPPLSSPAKRRGRQRLPNSSHAVPDSEDSNHLEHPQSSHENPPSRSASLDLVGDEDELQIFEPTTPRIKREFSTPPPTGFLFSTPAAQSLSRANKASLGVKSASGLSRNAYRKQVKQSWTKKLTPAPKSLSKRKSFNTLPRKRAWAEDGESEDELAK